MVKSIISGHFREVVPVPKKGGIGTTFQWPNGTGCGPYPIHGPARLAFKWKEKCEKKMWVDFRVLENPSPRRNGFTLESPLTFIFIFK